MYTPQFTPSAFKFGVKKADTVPALDPTSGVNQSPVVAPTGIDSSLTKDTANREQLANATTQFPLGMKPGDVVSSKDHFQQIPQDYKFDERASFIPGQDYVKPPTTAKIFNPQSGVKGSLVVGGSQAKPDDLYYSSRYGQNSVDKTIRGGDKFLAPTWEIDHIVPLALGGADNIYNKEVLDNETDHKTKTNLQAAILALYKNKDISKEEAINYNINWRTLNPDGIKDAGAQATSDIGIAQSKLKEWRGQPTMRVKDYLNAFSQFGSDMPNTVLGVATKNFLNGLSFGAFASAPSKEKDTAWADQTLGQKGETVAKTVAGIAGNVAGSVLATEALTVSLGAAGIGFAPAIFKGLQDTSKASRMAKLAGTVSRGAFNIARTDARALLASTIGNVAYGQIATGIRNWDEDTIGAHLKRASVDLTYGALGAYVAPGAGKVLSKIPKVSQGVAEAATVATGIFTLSKLEGYTNSEAAINALTGGTLHAASGVTDPIKIRDKADQAAIAWWQSLGMPTPKDGIFSQEFIGQHVGTATEQIQKNAPMAKARATQGQANVVTSEMRSPTAIKNDMENLQLVSDRLVKYGDRLKANKSTFGDSARVFFGLKPKESVTGKDVHETSIEGLREIMKYSREAKDTALYGVPPEILASTDAVYGLASNLTPEFYGATVDRDLGAHAGSFQKAPVDLFGTQAFAIEPVNFNVSKRAETDARFYNNHYAGSKTGEVDFSSYFGGDFNNQEAIPKAVLVNDKGTIEAWGYDRQGGSYFLGKIPDQGVENNIGGKELVTYMDANNFKAMPVSIRSIAGAENPAASLVMTGSDLRVAQKFMPVVASEFQDRQLARDRSTSELARFNAVNDKDQQAIMAGSAPIQPMSDTLGKATEAVKAEAKATEPAKPAETTDITGVSEDANYVEPIDPDPTGTTLKEASNGTLDPIVTENSATSQAAKDMELQSIASGGVYNESLKPGKQVIPEEVFNKIRSIPESTVLDDDEVNRIVSTALKFGMDPQDAAMRRIAQLQKAPFLAEHLKASKEATMFGDEIKRLSKELSETPSTETRKINDIKKTQARLASQLKEVAAKAVVVTRDDLAGNTKGKQTDLGGNAANNLMDYNYDRKLLSDARKELNALKRRNSKLNKNGVLNAELENTISQQAEKVAQLEADTELNPSTKLTPFNTDLGTKEQHVAVIAMSGSGNSPVNYEPMAHETDYAQATGQKIDIQGAMNEMFGPANNGAYTNFTAYDAHPTMNRWHNRIYDAGNIDVERTKALPEAYKQNLAESWVRSILEKPVSGSSRFDGPATDEPVFMGKDLASRMKAYADHDMRGDSVPQSRVIKGKKVNGTKALPTAGLYSIPAKDMVSEALVNMGKVATVNPVTRKADWRGAHFIVPGATEGERGIIRLTNDTQKSDKGLRSLAVTDTAAMASGEMENSYKKSVNGWNKSRVKEFKIDRPDQKNVKTPDLILAFQKSDNPESFSEPLKNAIRSAETGGTKVKYLVNPTEAQLKEATQGIAEPLFMVVADETHNNGLGAVEATNKFGDLFFDKGKHDSFVSAGEEPLKVDVENPTKSVIRFHEATSDSDLMAMHYRVFSNDGDTGPLVRTASQEMGKNQVGVFVINGKDDTFGPQTFGEDGILSVEKDGRYMTFVDADRAKENFDAFQQSGDQRLLGVSYGNKYDVVPRTFEAYMDMLTTRESVAGNLKLNEKALSPEVADSVADSYMNAYNTARKTNNPAGPNNPWRSPVISQDVEEYGNYANGLLQYVDSAVKDVDFTSDLDKARSIRETMEEYKSLREPDFQNEDELLKIHNTALETVGKKIGTEIYNDFNEPIGKTIKLSKIKTKRFQMIDDEGNIQEIDNRGEGATPGDPMTEVDAMGNRKADKLATIYETLGAIRPSEDSRKSAGFKEGLSRESVVAGNVKQTEPMLMSPRERRYLGLMDDAEYDLYGGNSKFGGDDPKQEMMGHLEQGWVEEAKPIVSEILRSKYGISTDARAITAKELQSTDPKMWKMVKETVDNLVEEIDSDMEEKGSALVAHLSSRGHDFDPNSIGRDVGLETVLAALINEKAAAPSVESSLRMTAKRLITTDPSYIKQAVTQAVPDLFSQVIGKDLPEGKAVRPGYSVSNQSSLGKAVSKAATKARQAQSEASKKLQANGTLTKAELADAIESINLQSEVGLRGSEIKGKAYKYEAAKKGILGAKVNTKAMDKKVSKFTASPLGRYIYDGLVQYYGEGNPKIAELLDVVPKFETFKSPIGSKELGLGNETGAEMKKSLQENVADMVESGQVGDIGVGPVWASTNRSKKQPKLVKMSSEDSARSYTNDELTAMADAMLKGTSQEAAMARISKKAKKGVTQDIQPLTDAEGAKLGAENQEQTFSTGSESRQEVTQGDVLTLPLTSKAEVDYKNVASNVLEKYQDIPEELLQDISEGKMTEETMANWDGTAMRKIRKWIGDDIAAKFSKDYEKIASGAQDEAFTEQLDQRTRITASNIVANLLKDEPGANTSQIGRMLEAMRTGQGLPKPTANVTDLRTSKVLSEPKAQARGVSYSIKPVKGAELVAGDPLNGSGVLGKDEVQAVKTLNERTPVQAVYEASKDYERAVPKAMVVAGHILDRGDFRLLAQAFTKAKSNAGALTEMQLVTKAREEWIDHKAKNLGETLKAFRKLVSK